MESFQNLVMGLGTALHPVNLFYCFIGVLIGTLTGVLPGIGPVGAISLLLPVTFHVPPVSAFIMFAGIMYGAQYGGSTTSILVNIPGEASSVITCMDGYAMARKGRAGPALGMAAFASFIAGTGTLFGLVLIAPPLAEFGLRFGPPEYFSLMVCGLTIVVYLARGSIAKALMMMSFGLILAAVGLDPISSHPRFTYGVLALRDGVGLAQVVIGLFGVSEVLITVERSFSRVVFETKIKELLPTLQDWKDSILPVLRASILGFFMGIIPGISVVIPTFVSYSLEKKLSKYPEKFGTGVIEGVAGPEAANNAAASGTLVPLLSLGIPAGASSAIVLGALMIYGLNPGPLLIKESPQVFWGVIGSMYIGNVMLLLLNLPLIGIWVKILKIPYGILFSLIILFCLIGSYTINNSLTDMYIMTIFGVMGYLMKKFDYEATPLILALVLGPMMENALHRSMIISRGGFLVFFQRPISAIFFGMALLILLSSFLSKKKLGEDILNMEE
ncbi:MAG TPA: tripartite tricarboxylate transporter permease [Syntrophorhabdales bacterium]|nr:tripartite tricarboxylate transporter permease [Syntrophorhabdales bacterium]